MLETTARKRISMNRSLERYPGRPLHTGAMVKLALAAAKGTFENVLVWVAVVFVT